MKKTAYSILSLLVLLSIVLLSSCSEPKSVKFTSNASNIYVNSSNNNCLSFSVALFSEKIIRTVEYIGMTGENLDSNNYCVNIIDNNIEKMNSYSHNKMFIKYIMVEIFNKSSAENLKISSLLLNVDGQIRELLFENTINHTYSEGNVFTEPLEISIVPNEIPSYFINSSEIVTYEFYANEDVILEGIRFKDFISCNNVMYALDNEKPQIADFPLDIPEGKTIKISFSLASNYADSSSYVETNIYFDYNTKEAGTKYYNSAIIVFDPIYPLFENDNSKIDLLIDDALNNSK